MRYSLTFLLAAALLQACNKEKFYDLKDDCHTGTSTTKKILLLGIDGCRTDALLDAETPAIDSLVAESYHNWHCDRGEETWSVPGWSTLLHGVFPDKHNLTINSFAGNKYEEYPDIFHYLRQADASLNLVTLSSWDDFLRITTNESYAQIVANDDEIKEEAIRLLDECTPDVMLLHFNAVDHSGHFKGGFSPNNNAYINAIEDTDARIADIMAKVYEREQLYGEEWMVMVVTDHGGKGAGHGGQEEVEETRFVFEIVRLPNLSPIELPEADNTNIMPTMLRYFGVSIDSTWELDGQAIF